MRSKMIVVSLVLHVALALGALRYATETRQKRRATAVAVVNKVKEKPPKKEEEKPKPKVEKPKPPPPPKQELASAKPEVAPSHAPKVEAAPQAAPVESGLTLGNDDGPGIAIGGAAKKGDAPKSAPPTPGEKKSEKKQHDKVAAEQKAAEEDTCTEAPSKPAPLTRPSEIEYTQEARSSGVEGRLVLKITVNADGSVASVEVVSSVDAALDAAAIAAVKTWTFKPAMRCGKAMGGALFTLARRFELGD